MHDGNVTLAKPDPFECVNHRQWYVRASCGSNDKHKAVHLHM